MAIGIAPQPDFKNMSWGPVPVAIVNFTGDASYPTGGYPVPPSQLAMRNVWGVSTIATNTAAAPYSFVYNTQTDKFQIFQTGAAVSGPLAEVGSGTNVSALQWTGLVIGIR